MYDFISNHRIGIIPNTGNSDILPSIPEMHTRFSGSNIGTPQQMEEIPSDNSVLLEKGNPNKILIA